MIDSTIKEAEEEPKYPFLAISDGCIVLFLKYKQGVCVYAGDSIVKLGELECFDLSKFEEFRGSVTLRSR